jgi:hypothetical protein
VRGGESGSAGEIVRDVAYSTNGITYRGKYTLGEIMILIGRIAGD